jgi:type IV pilus assembly protein PilA
VITVKHRNAEGFTIVELMIVVAIVSVLALVALPVYLDYTVRSKVSEALVFMSEAKTSVTDSYHSNNRMPTSNAEAGLREADNYNAYDYISRLRVVGGAEDPNEPLITVAGTVVATLKLPGTTSHEKELILEPVEVDGEIGWMCRPHPDPDKAIQSNRIPGDCRN